MLLAVTWLAGPASAQANCNPVVTANRAGGETTPALAFDGNVGTFFRPVLGFASPGFNTLVTIDFGCVRTLERFRRYLSRDGSDVAGNRGLQLEQVRYSLDGVNHTYLTAANSSGWDAFEYQPPLWRTLPYGWSPWAVLDAPVQARYLGFVWGSGAIGEPLHEIEVGQDLHQPVREPRQRRGYQRLSGNRRAAAGFRRAAPRGFSLHHRRNQSVLERRPLRDRGRLA